MRNSFEINQFKLQYQMFCNISRFYLIFVLSVFFKPTEERSLFHKGKILDHEVGQDYQDDSKDSYVTDPSPDSVKRQFYHYFLLCISVLSRGGYS